MAKICQLHADLRYFLCMQPVDMRKQFQGLQGIVNEEFGPYLTLDEAFARQLCISTHLTKQREYSHKGTHKM